MFFITGQAIVQQYVTEWQTTQFSIGLCHLAQSAILLRQQKPPEASFSLQMHRMIGHVIGQATEQLIQPVSCSPSTRHNLIT